MKKLCTLFFFIVLAMMGCKESSLDLATPSPALDQVNQSTDDPSLHVATGPQRTIKLGEKLNNPYSVANMELALELLRDSLRQQNNTGVSLDAVNTVEIYTTNLYVRLCATDDQSNHQLNSDSTLSLFNTPRDYSVAETGNYYADTVGVINTKYQWWYATVKPDFQPASGVHCEILDELFIPRNSRYSNGDGVLDKNFEQILLIASFNLTNNQDQLRTAKQGGADTRLNEGNQRSFMGTPMSVAATRAKLYPARKSNCGSYG